jgi:hypothetical protein
MHERQTSAAATQKRTGQEKARFEKILESCLLEQGLPKPRKLDRVQEVVRQIPKGVSPTIDKYRQALDCAQSKEEMVIAFERDIAEGATSDSSKEPQKGGPKERKG